jgi:hypothetical protein
MNKEKLIRSYFKFKDINQTEPIKVLPLSIMDLLIEFEGEIKTWITENSYNIENQAGDDLTVVDVEEMENYFKDMFNEK